MTAPTSPNRLLSAMRKEFGGHDEKLDQTIGETK